MKHLNHRIVLFSLIFISTIGKASSQSIELAGTITTTYENLFRNLPGVSAAYSYHLKKQFFFLEFQTAQRNNYENSEVIRTIHADVPYYAKITDGSFQYSSMNLGVAQKLITRESFDFSIGLRGGLNYYRMNAQTRFLSFYTFQTGTIDDERIDDKRNHKPGIGLFLDMELKQIVFSNLSLFSRVDFYHSDYSDKPIVHESMPKINNLNMLGFRLGVKYRFS
jgi:hypothetical protein